jgi:hypothetical protein
MTVDNPVPAMGGQVVFSLALANAGPSNDRRRQRPLPVGDGL